MKYFVTNRNWFRRNSFTIWYKRKILLHLSMRQTVLHFHIRELLRYISMYTIRERFCMRKIRNVCEISCHNSIYEKDSGTSKRNFDIHKKDSLTSHDHSVIWKVLLHLSLGKDPATSQWNLLTRYIYISYEEDSFSSQNMEKTPLNVIDEKYFTYQRPTNEKDSVTSHSMKDISLHYNQLCERVKILVIYMYVHFLGCWT